MASKAGGSVGLTVVLVHVGVCNAHDIRSDGCGEHSWKRDGCSFNSLSGFGVVDAPL